MKKEKKTVTRFHQSMQVCIKKNMAALSAVVCCSKVSFTIKWKKNCQIDKRQLYSRIFAQKIKSAANISSHLWLRRRFCRSYFLFWLKKKNCLTVSLIGSTCVCFCRKTVLPVFNLTRFDWVLARFRKRSDAQLINFWRNKLFFFNCVECRSPPSSANTILYLPHSTSSIWINWINSLYSLTEWEVRRRT